MQPTQDIDGKKSVISYSDVKSFPTAPLRPFPPTIGLSPIFESLLTGLVATKN
ncbi:hypothetical protein L4D09_06995 [Photobacterium makurazakiensis]|uniref:hypothetical protein n=1 Tax=Photobacterium makurazakiensis TaxID=2910234 RepID=UPI003D14B17C